MYLHKCEICGSDGNPTTWPESKALLDVHVCPDCYDKGFLCGEDFCKEDSAVPKNNVCEVVWDRKNVIDHLRYNYVPVNDETIKLAVKLLEKLAGKLRDQFREHLFELQSLQEGNLFVPMTEMPRRDTEYFLRYTGLEGNARVTAYQPEVWELCVLAEQYIQEVCAQCLWILNGGCSNSKEEQVIAVCVRQLQWLRSEIGAEAFDAEFSQELKRMTECLGAFAYPPAVWD